MNVLEENRGEIIKSIKKKKKEILIIFESGQKLALSPSTFTDFRLFEGKMLSKEEFLKLLSSINKEEYLEYALSLLSRENYPSNVIYEKLLNKGVDSLVANQIIDKLTKDGLLNDELYAKTYAKDVAELRLYGKNKILFNLHAKGLSNKIISSLSFPRDKELLKAISYAKILDKRLAKTPKNKKISKALLCLRERGFDLDVAKEAVDKALSFLNEEENNLSLESDFNEAKAKYERKYKGYKLSQMIISSLLRKGYDYEDIIGKVRGCSDED